MNPTPTSVDLTKMTAEELTALKAYLQAQIVVINYQSAQQDKTSSARIAQFTTQSAQVDEAIAKLNTPAV